MSAKPGTSPGSQNLPYRLDWSWQYSAACRGENVVLFFAGDGETRPRREVREAAAKAICAACPVRARCLDYALATSQRGLWGGMSDDDRDKERRRRGRKANAEQARAKSLATDADDEGMDLVEAAS